MEIELISLTKLSWFFRAKNYFSNDVDFEKDKFIL